MDSKTKKKALGKGIEAFIPGGKPKKTVSNESSVMFVDINDVDKNNAQPRKTFDKEKLEELSESIKLHGIVQPIVVTEKDDHYVIVAGERRWRAAKLAGLKKVPVIVSNYSPQEVMEIALIENIQREDLNPIEEAMAYKSLIGGYKLKQEEVAKRVGKSRAAVTNSLRLLNLEPEVQMLLVDGNISSGHARALLALKKVEKQAEVAQKIVDSKLSVRAAEKLVKEINEGKEKVKVKETLPNEAIYEDAQKNLEQCIGTKVNIRRKDKDSGKIEIEYYSDEDLERILEFFK